MAKSALSNVAEHKYNCPVCFQITACYDFNLFVNFVKRSIVINKSLAGFSKENTKNMNGRLSVNYYNACTNYKDHKQKCSITVVVLINI